MATTNRLRFQQQKMINKIKKSLVLNNDYGMIKNVKVVGPEQRGPYLSCISSLYARH